MKAGGKILVGLVLVGVLVTVAYFSYKKVNKTLSATPDQFKKLVSTATSTGKDVFQGLDSKKLSEMEEKFTSNLSQEEMNDLIFIFSKNEKDLTHDEMKKLKKYYFKATGDLIGI